MSHFTEYNEELPKNLERFSSISDFRSQDEFEQSEVYNPAYSYSNSHLVLESEKNREILQNLRGSVDTNKTEAESLNPSYQRLTVSPPDLDLSDEVKESTRKLSDCIALRKKYAYPFPRDKKIGKSPTPVETLFSVQIPEPSKHEIREIDGVYHVYENSQALEESKPLVMIPSLGEYYKDLVTVLKYISDPTVQSYCFRRLKFLEAKFNLHLLLNEQREKIAQKMVPHRDFYNVRKVDTHIHHSSSMNQKHLLKFIKKKIRECGDEQVIVRGGKVLTLKEVFESLNMTPYKLSIDNLDVHADKNTFHRFDKFGLKYNPIGESRLREIFLKQDNFISGRYLAELTHELFSNLAQSKYLYSEYRISIYGRSINEWKTLAAWVVDNKLFSEHNRWLIQIPRLYSTFKESNAIQNMGELVENIFKPLFEVTKDPTSCPKLHIFLQQVVGFDCVDDESILEKKWTEKHPPPRSWTRVDSPPYTYYLFYLWANLKSLNEFRALKGFTTFALRPHSGEAGEIDHLVCTFLLANQISHGINLRKTPSLQYLYYLTQIGIAMSPLSNNSLFLAYNKNPLPQFFARGLNVSLSTDDPLQFHYSKEPLIEEYSIAAQLWKLSDTDLCEIARNSILQSGFEPELKRLWLGENYDKPGPIGNEIDKTNVPNIRICYRTETLQEELKLCQIKI